MKIMLHLIAFFLCSIMSFAQALIEIPITFNDGVVGSRVLIVGLDPTATDGLDPILGETPAPPLPPFGAFDARFTLPNSSNQTFKDIREGDNTAISIGNRIHTVNYQLGTGSTGLNINWNLPRGVELNLIDPYGGVLFNVDFLTGTGNYTVASLALTSLLMTVKYIEPPFPVELTSFTGRVTNEFVQLNWETETEINNYGFNIERKSETSEWTNIGFVLGNGNSNSTKKYNYNDTEPIGGSKFLYRLKQIDNDGKFEYSDVIEVEVIPTRFELSQNYPNPFNPSTTLMFSLPKQTQLKISIYNMLGELVETVAEGQYEAGYFKTNLILSNLASGIYFYRLESKDFTQTRKFVLIK